jgi:DNA-binding transcriptional LysR family regulator
MGGSLSKVPFRGDPSVNSPPFPQLQSFLAVAKHRSFSGAARELGVSRSAVSQAVQQLETQLKVVLLVRTTRSVSLTEAGRRLVENAGPAFGQVVSAFHAAAAQPGEAVGRVRLSVPRSAVPFVIVPVLPLFRERHPRIDVDIVVEDRLVDIVREGYDAGVRLIEIIERDMVQVRLTKAFRFVVVGTPRYLAKRRIPQRPEDLLHHECITFHSPTTGAPYAWEFERGRRTWRIPVRGGIVTNDGLLCASMAKLDLGLAYAPEPFVAEDLRRGKLETVIDAFAPKVAGYFLYYPNRAQRSGPLRLFVETALEILGAKREAGNRVNGCAG